MTVGVRGRGACRWSFAWGKETKDFRCGRGDDVGGSWPVMSVKRRG